MADPVRHDEPRDDEDERRSPRLMTMEEYFVFEHASPIRHEFVAGEVFAMVGESKRHSRVAGNTSRGPELDDEYCEEAPCLLVEVLSRSTRRTDQREKLAAYTTIPSLGTYLLVEQRRRLRRPLPPRRGRALAA